MHNMNKIDITPGNDSLSPEEAEKYRAEYQPRGHESLQDATNMAKQEEELRSILAEKGYDLVEDKQAKPEKKITPIALVERFKKDKPFRKRVTVITGAVLLSAGLVAGSVAAAHAHHNKEVKAAQEEASNAGLPEMPVIVINDQSEAHPQETNTEASPEKAEAIGFVDGYEKEGLWTDENKPNTVAFSNFQKVVDMFDGDYKSAAKYDAENQIEVASDYISALHKLRPAGFENLDMAEVNDKMENQMSDEEKDKLLHELNDIFDNADVSPVTLNGEYTNAYEAVKDGNDLIGSKEALKRGASINHETMQLVGCTTKEKNTPAHEFVWRDDNGNIIDSIIIKDYCGQVVEKKGSSTRLASLPQVTEKAIQGGGAISVITGGGPATPNKPSNPDKPDNPPDTPDTPDIPEKKWGKSGDPHAGNDYLQTIVTNPAVPNIKDINNGNQGYVDDNQAAPGSASDLNGVDPNTGFADSGITAPGANTEDGRLSGGEDQSDGNIAGDNAHHDQASEDAGRAADEGGNKAQEQAQQDNKVGQDNNSDKQEEDAVARGDF